MSEQEFEDYLILLSRFLGLSPAQRESIAEELRDHMHERLEVLQRLGVPRKEAIREALAEFGDASRLASELSLFANRKQQKRRWVMRLTAGSLAAVAVTVMVAMAIWPDPMPGPGVSDAKAQLADSNSAEAAGQEDESTPPSLEAAAQGKIRAALRKKGQLKFKDVTLTEMMESLEKQLGIQIEADNRTLDDIGIEVSSDTIEFSEPPMSYAAALRHILRSLDLTTVVTNGVLMITSVEVAENEHATRLYPVWDLVRIPREARDESRSDYDSLLEVITATVAPESWQELGGPGSLAPHKGLLLISQTDEAQRQVEALLNALREFTRPDEAATDNPGSVRLTSVDVGDNAAKRLIRKKLEQEISVDFVESPLDDVAEYAQQTMQVPVIVDHQALDDIGVSSSSDPTTLSLQGVSLRSALRLILANLDLTYILRDEALVITSREEAENQLTTRLYSAADLIDIVDATDYEQIKVELEELADVLMTIVGPESWSSVGGPGVLKVYASRGVLICSNTSEVHERIASLLGDMARARRNPQAASRRRASYDPAEIVVETYKLNPMFVGSSDIVEVITELVDPASWQTATKSPTRPYLKLFSGTLIVRHRRDVQREVQRLLRRLGVVGPHLNSGFGVSGAAF